MCNMCTRDEVKVMPEEVEGEAKPDNRTIERMKKKHNITTNPADEEKQKEVAYQPDLLAVSTQHTKVVYDVLKRGCQLFKDSNAYVVITKTSQPIQFAVGLLVALLWLNQPCNSGNLKLWQLLYVGAVATRLGAQIWMTLISGIVLYFSLPRHEFGRVQTVLFPVYYAFNAGVSLVALLSYLRAQSITKFENTSYTQIILLLVVFGIEAYVRLSLVKPMLRAKHIKTQMEESAGTGTEVGRLVLGELAHCPRYIRELRLFRSYHSTIAMGTMITLSCSIYSIIIIVDALC